MNATPERTPLRPPVASRQRAKGTRSCFRCGRDFPTDSRGRSCPQCKADTETNRETNDDLSSRERQVTALVAQGKSNRQIADSLYLAEGTIKVYLQHIYEKLQIHNRTELALYWMREKGGES